MNPYEGWVGYGATLVPGAKFWVAVEGHASDPTREPTERRTGDSFVAAEVWKAADEYLFNYNGFYRIPQAEYVHIEGIVDENESKEDETMTTKTATTTAKTNAKTATAKKRLPRAEWAAQYVASLEAKVAELAPKHEDAELETPVNLYHTMKAEKEGKETATALYASELEAKVLALTCAEKGWSAEYLTERQAEVLHGVIPEDEQGVKLHGKNIARGYTFYNVAQVKWEYGEPMWDEDIDAAHMAEYAQNAITKRANNALKKANELGREAGLGNAKRGGKKGGKKTTKKAAPKPEPKAEGVNPDVLAAIVAKAVAEALKAANVA